MGIVRRTTCRSPEAGGKTRSLWYGPVATGMPVSQRSALVFMLVDCKRRIGQQKQSQGILFQEVIFSFSRYSHRANAFRLVGIACRTTCASVEAGDKTCAVWYGPVATGMPVLQRSALVVLRVDCKRRVGQQQQSRGILFR